MLPALVVGTVPVFEVSGALCWRSGLAVDGDGGPHCYKPGGGGLDSLHNAMHAPSDSDLVHPAHGWAGIATDALGEPIIQGPADLAPGYYISPTSLFDPSYAPGSSRQYVNAEEVPYIVLAPELLRVGAQLGDVGMVCYRGASCAVIAADIGPHGHLSEGSISLAMMLGIPSSPRNGGVSSGVMFVLWPGSTKVPRWPRTNDDIAAQVSVLFDDFGGAARLAAAV